jgi:nucleotide-binding universal stress UspA family protein
MNITAWQTFCPTAASSIAEAAAEPSQILVSLTPNHSQPSIDIGLALAEGADADLVFLSPAVFPVQTPRYLAENELAEYRQVLKCAVQTAERRGFDGSVTAEVRIGRNHNRIVTNAVNVYDSDIIVLGVSSRSGRLTQLRGTRAERIAARTKCDVVSVAARTSPKNVASILVPVAGGPHSGLAVDMARTLQQAYDAWVDILHVVDTEAAQAEHDRAKDYVMAGLDRLDAYETASPWILEAPDVTAAIVEQTAYYDLTVLGAPRTQSLKRLVFGSITDDVRTGVLTTPVLTTVSHPDGLSLSLPTRH